MPSCSCRRSTEVAVRALILHAVCTYSDAVRTPMFLRPSHATDGSSAVSAMLTGLVSPVRQQLWTWLETWGMVHFLEPPEHSFMTLSVLDVGASLSALISWQHEGLAVLEWFLGRLPRLAAVAESAETLLISLPPVKFDNPSLTIHNVQPRDHESLLHAFREGELWWWRAQIASAQHANFMPPETWDWPRLIRMTLLLANREGLLPDPVEDDFAVDGRPYRELEPWELADIQIMARERYRALAWLTLHFNHWYDSEIDKVDKGHPHETIVASTVSGGRPDSLR